MTYHDPFVPTFSEDEHTFSSVPLTAATVAGADCVVVITDHSAIEWDMVKRNARVVVDTRHVLPRGS